MRQSGNVKLLILLLWACLIVMEVVCKTGHQILRLTVIGRTGDGKSAFSNMFLKHFDPNTTLLFEESSDASSQTSIPTSRDVHIGSHMLVEGHTQSSTLIKPYTQYTVRLTDTPGLIDTRGHSQDDFNMKAIVSFLKKEGEHGLWCRVKDVGCMMYDLGCMYLMVYI
ncbi:hypothetical protein EON63_18435 [archaeon]|nr:MAG: hypothetical protein EON63_18435 [archaeon]